MNGSNRVTRLAIAGCIAALPAAALAQDRPQDKSFDPTFGSRIENRDGSAALTVGRTLPTEWDSKVGFDATVAAEPGNGGMADTMLHGRGETRSSGTVWGTVTGPGLAPLIWDRTSVDARINPGDDQGRIAATMSRTVPLGGDISLTLQNRFSVTQSLQGNVVTNQQTQTPGSAAPAWETDRSVRLNLEPTGTILSAGVVSTADNQWQNKLTAEQQLFGPFSVTTSVTEPASGSGNKSITARFKRTW